jgi:Protein of unknown function (DUF2889)
MPLSPPASRKLMHTREIACKGYEREDGLWDIEAELKDTKTYLHTRQQGGRERQPGQPVHHMWLRLTIDLDMVVHDVEAVTDEGPFPHCGNVVPHFKRLIGLKIGAGWRREIAARVGGIEGCTHLVELLGPLGTTAFQATGRARNQRRGTKPVTTKPYQLNSCHVYADDSDEVKVRWPDFYTGSN